MFTDTLAGNVTYPDQQDIDWIGDIKVITGVKNEAGYISLYNSGDQYCKVQVTFEDESTRIYKLEPDESIGRKYMSIYNQADHAETICGSTRDVFYESFN